LQAKISKDLLHLPGFNHPRNGIIWCAALEIAYTDGAFGLGVDDSNDHFFCASGQRLGMHAAEKISDVPKGASTSEQVTPRASFQYGVIDLRTPPVHTFGACKTMGKQLQA